MFWRCLEIVKIWKVSCGCLEGMWRVLKECLEGFRGVSEECLEGFYNVSGRCMKYSWKVFGRCLISACWIWWGCQEVTEGWLESVKLFQTKFLVPKCFGTHNFFEPKILLYLNIFGTQNISGQKFSSGSKFLDPKFLEPTVFGPKFSWTKNFLGQAFLLDHNFFKPLKMLGPILDLIYYC